MYLRAELLGPQSLSVLAVMGASCVKLAMKGCQKGQEKHTNKKQRLMKIKAMSGRENSENKDVTKHDDLMQKFKEIEKSIENEKIMIRDKLRSEEREFQLRKDKIEKIEIEVERKRAEIAEKLLLVDQKIADMQSKIFKKEARNKKVLRTLEERIGEIERASVERGGRLKLLMKCPLTRYDSIGEEKEDGEY